MIDVVAKSDRPGKIRLHRIVNLGTVVAEQAFIGGSTFLTLVLVKRAGGETELGIFSLALTLLYFLMALHESLITTPYTVYGNRLHGDAKRTYLGNSLLQHFVLCGITFPLLFLAGVATGFFSQTVYLMPVLITVACVAPLWLSREFSRRVALSELRLRSAISVSGAYGILLALSLGFLYVSSRLTPTTCLASIGVASLISATIWFIRNRPRFRLVPSKLASSFKKNWFLGKWMVASQISSAFGSNTVPWILAIYSGTAAVGVLAACDSVLRLANPLLKAASNILVPKASLAIANGGRPEAARVLWRATAELAVFITIFFVVIAIAGGWFLVWIFGPEFAQYRLCLTLLASSQWLITLTMPVGCGILVFERSDLNLRNDLIGTVVTLGSVATLCFFYEGVFGAATGMAIGNAARFVLTLVTFYLLSHEEISLATDDN